MGNSYVCGGCYLMHGVRVGRELVRCCDRSSLSIDVHLLLVDMSLGAANRQLSVWISYTLSYVFSYAFV